MIRVCEPRESIVGSGKTFLAIYYTVSLVEPAVGIESQGTRTTADLGYKIGISLATILELASKQS